MDGKEKKEGDDDETNGARPGEKGRCSARPSERELYHHPLVWLCSLQVCRVSCRTLVFPPPFFFICSRCSVVLCSFVAEKNRRDLWQQQRRAWQLYTRVVKGASASGRTEKQEEDTAANHQAFKIPLLSALSLATFQSRTSLFCNLLDGGCGRRLALALQLEI